MCLCQLMELLFQRVKKYSGTAKTPLVHSYFGALLSGPHPHLRSFLLGTRLTSRPLCMNVNRCSESMQNRIINDVFRGSFLLQRCSREDDSNASVCLEKQVILSGEAGALAARFRMNREGFYSTVIERQS